MLNALTTRTNVGNFVNSCSCGNHFFSSDKSQFVPNRMSFALAVGVSDLGFAGSDPEADPIDGPVRMLEIEDFEPPVVSGAFTRALGVVKLCTDPVSIPEAEGLKPNEKVDENHQ